MMFLLGMFVGAIIGFGLAMIIVANEDEENTRSIRTIALISFAEKLKKKASANAEDWEEPCFFLSDIDEVFEEMVGVK